jgi:hypothetical protein
MRKNDLWPVVASALFAPVLAACSSNLNWPEINLPRVGNLTGSVAYAGRGDNLTLPAVPPDALIGPEGQCVGVASDPPPQLVAQDPTVPPGHPAPPGSPAASDPPTSPLVAGGIALQMAECDVVRRAGRPEKVDIGTNGRNERVVVLTYTGGPWPGIYRFASGRLYSIEAAPTPPAPPKKQKRKRPVPKRA